LPREERHIYGINCFWWWMCLPREERHTYGINILLMIKWKAQTITWW
jgi:hypothetical protein